MNKKQALSHHRLSEELLAASIIKSSIDLNINDISLSIILLSSFGTQIAEIEVSYDYNRVLRKFAELN